MITPRAHFLLLACLLSVLSPLAASAAMSTPVTYYGHSNGGPGGPVANGSLTLKDNGTTVYGTFTKASGMSFQLGLVLYIDSVSGGFTSTAGLSDSADPGRTEVSGYYRLKNQRATANFAPGFTADYAIIIGVNPNMGTGNDLYLLNTGGDGSLTRIGSIYLNPNNDLNSPTYTFTFNWSAIGITASDPHFFRFQSTYLSGYGSRTLESFETLTGQAGYSTVTFSNYNTYGVAPVPEMATTALAIFGGVFAGTGLLRRAARFLRKRPCPPHDERPPR